MAEIAKTRAIDARAIERARIARLKLTMKKKTKSVHRPMVMVRKGRRIVEDETAIRRRIVKQRTKAMHRKKKQEPIILLLARLVRSLTTVLVI